MLKVLIKLPLLSFTAMEDADLDVTGGEVSEFGRGSAGQAKWECRLLHTQIGFPPKTAIAS